MALFYEELGRKRERSVALFYEGRERSVALFYEELERK